jgi:phage terminase large subunit-like protein
MGRPRSAWREYAVGSEVAHFAKFCEQHLVQSEDRWEGHPLRLEAWQRRMMGEALAYDSSGWPMWRSVVIVAPRKNGKTALLAAVALYRLLTAEGRPEILLAASSDKQADRLFSAAARFVRRSPELSRLCRVRDHVGEIVREDGMGVIYRLSSDAKRLHGYNPTDVICDELAQWITKTLRDAFAALTSGGGARSAPQVFTITTAGEASTRHDSILGRILDAMTPEETEHASAALQIGRLAEAQTLVWKYEAPTTDARDIKALKMANPASWITKEYLRRQTANPELSDAEVLQLHGCVWAATESTWISPADWDACLAPGVALADGDQIVLGFDGSEKRDATVLAAARLDGFVVPLAIWKRPPRVEEWRVPRREVHEAVAHAFETYDVLELAADPPGWYAEIDQWTDLYGEERVVAFDTKQVKRFAPACERFRTGVQERRVSHNGHPILAQHVGNAQIHATPYGDTIAKDHPDSPRKVDAAVAVAIAHDRAMWHVANQAPTFSWRVVK